jgi:hypothetical protein
MNPIRHHTADVATDRQNTTRQIPPAPRLSMHSILPTTSQEFTDYIEQLLSKDEQSTCDMATD